MAKNRQAAQDRLYELIEKLAPNSGNVDIYKNIFSQMDDEQFDTFIGKLKSGESKLAVISPIANGNFLDVKRNLDLAKELGHEFFERVWMDAKGDMPSYLSNDKYLIVDLPSRRQAQLLIKKISIPENSHTMDNRTGQAAGPAKSSRISYPEIQIMAALGLDNAIVEFTKYRGGDVKGYLAMNKSISDTGGVSMQVLDKLGTKVKVTKVLSVYLTCMHLRNTLTAE